MRAITEINIHCAATRPVWMAGSTPAQRVAEIRRWHTQLNGWADIGYHYVVDRDGTVTPGRPIARSGAFEPKVNRTAIGICLVGGYGSAATDSFSEHYTPEQDVALRELIERLQAEHPTIKRVTGHNDYSPKACPGFKVQRWLAGKPERSFAESGTAIGSGTATAAASGLALVEVAAVATKEVRTAVEEARTARTEAQAAAADAADPLRWVLIAVIIAGAAFALYRRWVDWQAGRR